MVAEARVAIDTLASLIEDAFERDPDQSLMSNLRECARETGPLSMREQGRSVASRLAGPTVQFHDPPARHLYRS